MIITDITDNVLQGVLNEMGFCGAEDKEHVCMLGVRHAGKHQCGDKACTHTWGNDA